MISDNQFFALHAERCYRIRLATPDEAAWLRQRGAIPAPGVWWWAIVRQLPHARARAFAYGPLPEPLNLDIDETVAREAFYRLWRGSQPLPQPLPSPPPPLPPPPPRQPRPQPTKLEAYRRRQQLIAKRSARGRGR